MGMMIIRHKVRDYGLWRPIFNDHAEMKKAAGLTNPRVHHSAERMAPVLCAGGNHRVLA